jgi:hypothetical protein
MTRQVALLRGINVGGHNRVAMAQLCELMESLGHGDVCGEAGARRGARAGRRRGLEPG